MPKCSRQFYWQKVILAYATNIFFKESFLSNKHFPGVAKGIKAYATNFFFFNLIFFFLKRGFLDKTEILSYVTFSLTCISNVSQLFKIIQENISGYASLLKQMFSFTFYPSQIPLFKEINAIDNSLSLIPYCRQY